ncbi:MAG: Rrf2 family transcriptional regulator [Marinilabiliales bacterium]|nr:MAG: Rrf2 family transcriptional regulator [Bacteroidia bacterium]TVR75023.1 MAG: Rrf2 family transcriptional regulator [Marinilabiliales bacterium]
MSKIVAISEAASIALHGMILIAKSNPSINVMQIAERTGASRHHVAKIMQRLAKNNYLSSHRGPSGGFMLRKKPEEITFLEIYEAIEGEIEVTPCPLDKPVCPFDKCIMNNVTNKMTNKFREHLEKQTLDQYI